MSPSTRLPAWGRVIAFLDLFRQNIRADAIAGLTVAVMGVPQAMAYAMIAGLPPVYGLYTAIVPCLIAAAFGSSNHLVTGPTNAMCMVIFSLTASLPQRYNVSQLEIVLALTFMTGAFQFVFGTMKLGGIIKYVSNSVVVGFTAGAGILIAANQLKNLMGVKIAAGQGGHFFSTLWATAQQIQQTNPCAFAVGLVTILMLVGFRRWAPRLPGSLIALTAVTVLAWSLGWFGDGAGGYRVKIVRDIQEITPSLDIFGIPQMFLRPNLDLLRELSTGALALAILGLVESASIARSIAASSGQRLDFTREFKFQGVANLVGSFFHCFAASGSFTRSAVCYQSGARTRMAAGMSGLFTAAVILLFGSLANFIPQAGLAGILMVIAFTMIERERLVMTWRSGSNSRIVLGGTLAATLLMPLETAVFAGVMLSIVILLRITGKPDLTQLVQHPEYGFEEVPFNRAAPSPIAIINLEGDLHFAAAEDLDYELLQALRPETRVVVLRMKRLRAVGSSAMAMLEHFHKLLRSRGLQLIVCGVEDDMSRVLTGSGLRKLIGEQNIFYADNRIFQSTELAIARAKGIVEMQRARSEEATATVQQETLTGTTAGDLMQKRCLRFGANHQIREAMWLVSQFQKKMGTVHPQTVFLQDREGRLCGEVSVRSMLRGLASAVPEDNVAALDDRALGQALEFRLYDSVGTIARKDPVNLQRQTPMAEAFSQAARHSFRSMPVSDAHGRLTGIFDEMAMLHGLAKLLQAGQSLAESPPAQDPETAMLEAAPLR
jgi:SulP family sulfate permease